VSYELVIGNKNYSSWSMRAWLLLRFVDAPFVERRVNLYQSSSRAEVISFGGETGLVPVLIDDHFPIWDTLAITEHLYEIYPQIWPAEKTDRARARSFSGEVHSSLNALRAAMPINARGRNRVADRSPEVMQDIERVKSIWDRSGKNGPWLFSSFCAADIMFAPVALRFRTYDVALTGQPANYLKALLQHPLVEEWCALGKAEGETIDQFELPGEAGSVTGPNAT
jgi:glutathione S-transferase